MAKYFSFYLKYSNWPNNPFPGDDVSYMTAYYNQVNDANIAKYANTNMPAKNMSLSSPGEIQRNFITIEVPDSATSIIIKNNVASQTFQLSPTPPTVGTLFLTFDVL